MLRIDQADTSQDDVLNSLNMAARVYCETVTQRKFVEQQWSLQMDFFPGYIDLKLAGQRVSSPFVSGSNAVLVGIRYAIVPPCPPVRSLDAFTYINANGDVTDMMNGSQNPLDWNFVLDIESQPARVMPIFGEMWPVAQVIANALTLTYTMGYASPVTVSTTADSSALGTATFTSENVGQPVSIPGAGANGTTLNTVIQSVTSGVGTVRDVPQETVSAETALLVDFGNTSHWELIKTAIKVLVNAWFVNRLPSYDAAARDAIRALLMPICDKRF
jgi:hypothetical protein